MSEYSERFCENYPTTGILKSHTETLKKQKKIADDMKKADMNITKLCKDL